MILLRHVPLVKSITRYVDPVSDLYSGTQIEWWMPFGEDKSSRLISAYGFADHKIGLTYGCTNDNIALVKYCISRIEGIQTGLCYGIIIACQNKNYRILKYLLRIAKDKKIILNDKNRAHCVRMACKNNFKQGVLLLVKSEFCTPDELLAMAGSLDNLKFIKLAMRLGGDMIIDCILNACEDNKKPKSFNYLFNLLQCTVDKKLKIAAARGAIKLITEYAEFAPDSIDSAMILACKYGRKKAVELLIQYGARDYDDGLHAAAQGNRINTLKLMIEHGATDFENAACYACQSNNLRALKYINKFHDLQRIRMKLFGIAIQYGYMKIVNYLSHKFNINVYVGSVNESTLRNALNDNTSDQAQDDAQDDAENNAENETVRSATEQLMDILNSDAADTTGQPNTNELQNALGQLMGMMNSDTSDVNTNQSDGTDTNMNELQNAIGQLMGMMNSDTSDVNTNQSDGTDTNQSDDTNANQSDGTDQDTCITN